VGIDGAGDFVFVRKRRIANVEFDKKGLSHYNSTLLIVEKPIGREKRRFSAVVFSIYPTTLRRFHPPTLVLLDVRTRLCPWSSAQISHPLGREFPGLPAVRAGNSRPQGPRSCTSAGTAKDRLSLGEGHGFLAARITGERVPGRELYNPRQKCMGVVYNPRQKCMGVVYNPRQKCMGVVYNTARSARTRAGFSDSSQFAQSKSALG
jgi:hypothetical protein